MPAIVSFGIFSLGAAKHFSAPLYFRLDILGRFGRDALQIGPDFVFQSASNAISVRENGSVCDLDEFRAIDIPLDRGLRVNEHVQPHTVNNGYVVISAAI